MIFIFSIIVALHCSVNFYCTVERPSRAYIYIVFFVVAVVFLGLYPRPMEVPRLVV